MFQRASLIRDAERRQALVGKARLKSASQVATDKMSATRTQTRTASQFHILSRQITCSDSSSALQREPAGYDEVCKAELGSTHDFEGVAAATAVDPTGRAASPTNAEIPVEPDDAGGLQEPARGSLSSNCVPYALSANLHTSC